MSDPYVCVVFWGASHTHTEGSLPRPCQEEAEEAEEVPGKFKRLPGSFALVLCSSFLTRIEEPWEDPRDRTPNSGL